MDGDSATTHRVPLDVEFINRLRAAPDARLPAILSDLLPALYAIVVKHRVSREDLKATIAFLSDVETTCSDNRQEWILLADAFGVSTAIENASARRPKGTTPNTILGPFYREGAPQKKSGESISIDGIGRPLNFALRVQCLDGLAVARAQVEVWHANAKGRFENQEPDSQPEMNLRGQFTTNAEGQVRFQTVQPGAYALPGSGPVADLLTRLGLGLRRPAHIQFRVSAPGFMTLTTHVFDRNDPAIDADPLFSVQPDLLADFSVGKTQIVFTLARARPGEEDQ